jgi:hypothetical protein
MAKSSGGTATRSKRRPNPAKLRVVKQEQYKKSANAFADMLLDLRLREYYTSDKIWIPDWLAVIKSNGRAMAERVAERRRLRFLTIDGNIPQDFHQTGKRVVLA